MKKVLIIAGGLQIGGAERVAANISKYAPRGQFEFHYIVFEGIENVYGPEIESLGGTVFTIPSPSKDYWTYTKTLWKLMREHQYVAVHSHTMFNSGINLLIATISGVPCRIAHSHTTKTETKVSAFQKVYELLMRTLICITATDLFACGVDAGNWMFGKCIFSKKGTVISNGIDISEYSWAEEKRKQIRLRYGLSNEFVIGHTGTLIPLKNQKYLIKLMPQILKRRKNAKLMLVGGGTRENSEELTNFAKACGVADQVILCGGVNNVPDYLSAFDVFAFPSLREGTPLALIEAQANGLPCVISDRIPIDVHITELITVVSLEKENDWIVSLCNAERDGKDHTNKIVEKGYCANKAYQPIYETYLRCLW